MADVRWVCQKPTALEKGVAYLHKCDGLLANKDAKAALTRLEETAARASAGTSSQVTKRTKIRSRSRSKKRSVRAKIPQPPLAGKRSWERRNSQS